MQSKVKYYVPKKQRPHERVHKACDKTINKTYAEYKQRQLNKQGEKTGKVLDKHVISLYSTGISQVVKLGM